MTVGQVPSEHNLEREVEVPEDNRQRKGPWPAAPMVSVRFQCNFFTFVFCEEGGCGTLQSVWLSLFLCQKSMSLILTWTVLFEF